MVTGAGGGIGRAVASALARAGAAVVLNDRDQDLLASAATAIPHEPGALVTKAADVSTRDGALSVIDAAATTYGTVSVLVNVVGGMSGGMQRPFLEITEQQWDFAMKINLRTTFQMMQAALAVMIPNHRGRIVNFASTAWAGSPDTSDYAAAKAGVVALTRSVATQVGPHGVTVNAVAPGITLTDAVRPFYEDIEPDVPLGRWNEPDDIAGAVAFLCSDAARNISGQLITVAGGWNPSL